MASTFLWIFVLFHCINTMFLVGGDALGIETVSNMAWWNEEFYETQTAEIEETTDSQFEVWNPFALGGSGSTILNVWFAATGTSFLNALNIGVIHLPYGFIVGISFIVTIFFVIDIFNRLRGTPGE